MCFPQCGFETGGQKKREREKGARKHRRDFDLQSQKENRDSFGCQWELGGLEMPKGRFTLKKAVEQQEAEASGGAWVA